MDDLFVLALFSEEGEFVQYIRKGRNNAISGYGDISGARRGLSHAKRSDYHVIHNDYTIEIVKADGFISVKEDE